VPGVRSVPLHSRDGPGDPLDLADEPPGYAPHEVLGPLVLRLRLFYAFVIDEGGHHRDRKEGQGREEELQFSSLHDEALLISNLLPVVLLFSIVGVV